MGGYGFNYIHNQIKIEQLINLQCKLYGKWQFSRGIVMKSTTRNDEGERMPFRSFHIVWLFNENGSGKKRTINN